MLADEGIISFPDSDKTKEFIMTSKIINVLKYEKLSEELGNVKNE